jgi:hypothetical protein
MGKNRETALPETVRVRSRRAGDGGVGVFISVPKQAGEAGHASPGG